MKRIAQSLLAITIAAGILAGNASAANIEIQNIGPNAATRSTYPFIRWNSYRDWEVDRVRVATRPHVNDDGILTKPYVYFDPSYYSPALGFVPASNTGHWESEGHSKPLYAGVYWIQVRSSGFDDEAGTGVVEWSKPKRITVRKFSGKPTFAMDDERWGTKSLVMSITASIPTTLARIPMAFTMRVNGRDSCRSTKPLVNARSNAEASRDVDCRIRFDGLRPKGQNVLQIFYRIGSKATTGRVWVASSRSKF